MRANRLTRDAFFCILDSSQAGDRRGAGRGARRRLRAGRLLRHDLRRGHGGVRAARDRRRPGRRRELPAAHSAALEGSAHDADRRARPGGGVLSSRRGRSLPARGGAVARRARHGQRHRRQKRRRRAAHPQLVPDGGGARPARGLSRRAGLHDRAQPLAGSRGGPAGVFRGAQTAEGASHDAAMEPATRGIELGRFRPRRPARPPQSDHAGAGARSGARNQGRDHLLSQPAARPAGRQRCSARAVSRRCCARHCATAGCG